MLQGSVVINTWAGHLDGEKAAHRPQPTQECGRPLTVSRLFTMPTNDGTRGWIAILTLMCHAVLLEASGPDWIECTHSGSA